MSEDINGEQSEVERSVEILPDEVLHFFQYLTDSGVGLGIQGTSASKLTSIQKYGLIPGANVTNIDDDPSVASRVKTVEELLEALKARARGTGDLVYALNLSPQHNPLLQQAVEQGNAEVLLENLRKVVSVSFQHYHTQDANGAVVVLRTEGFESGGHGGTPLFDSIRKPAPVEPSDIIATFRSTSPAGKPLSSDVDRTVKQLISLRPTTKQATVSRTQ